MDAVINLLNETLLSLSQAADRFPPSRRQPGGNQAARLNPATVWRWTHTGAKSRSGKTVVLESIRIGRKTTFTSVQAIERFIAALNDGAQKRLDNDELPTSQPRRGRTEAQRKRAAAAAAKRNGLNKKAATR